MIEAQQTRPCVRSAMAWESGVATLESSGGGNRAWDVERERLLAAALHVVSRRGYELATFDEMVRTAGLPFEDGERHFDGKGECFFAAYDVVTGAMLDGARLAGDVRLRRVERVTGVLGFVLQRMATFPDVAQACVVELPYAGRAALERQDRTLERLAGLLLPLAGVPGGGGPPRAVLGQLLAGGVWETIRTTVVRDGPVGLPRLVPELVDWVLRGSGGPGTAD